MTGRRRYDDPPASAPPLTGMPPTRLDSVRQLVCPACTGLVVDGRCTRSVCGWRRGDTITVGDPLPPGSGGLRLRPGDQPLPVPNDLPDVQSMVIADIERRRELGISRYGTALQPHNGRDALQDAYDEALDLACYLRQAIAERDGTDG